MDTDKGHAQDSEKAEHVDSQGELNLILEILQKIDGFFEEKLQNLSFKKLSNERLSQDKFPEYELSKDGLSRGELSEDESPKDEWLKDRFSKDEVSEQEVSEDELSENELSEKGLPKIELYSLFFCLSDTFVEYISHSERYGLLGQDHLKNFLNTNDQWIVLFHYILGKFPHTQNQFQDFFFAMI
jgi:hypothetical protein